MKQTAVEWLFEQLKKNYYISNYAHYLIDDAKELEKEQLHKVWKAAEQNMRSQFSSSNYKNLTFDEYYETKT